MFNTEEVEKMGYKTLGLIQIVGGALALLFSGKTGYSGMMGMMGYSVGYNRIGYGGGLAVIILAVLFIITGIYNLLENKKKR